MNLAFRTNFTRKPASIAVPSPLAARNQRQKRLALAAFLRRGWNTTLRFATDAPEPHPLWYALNVDRRTMLGNLIERKARDMSQLLTNVLELMRMEFGSGTLRTDWHAIDDLVALALRTNEARLAQWRTVVNLPTDLPLILVEATLIVQLLSNLLENAGKYTPPGTTITISAAVREKSILLVVADDGPGLPPGDPERLFEKFQRGRSESNIVGVGLGLAICRAAARLHGGDVHATDNVGGGARFEIALPMETQVDAAPPTEPL
jgi:two-component system sensor histidine kinase KdpD